MALITCVDCGRRISNQYRTCPHCDAPMADLTPEELSRRAWRRYKRRAYRARMVTYVGMTLVIAGLIVWYLTGGQGLQMPPGVLPTLSMGVGLIVYLAAWAWLLWLRWQRPPTG